MATAVTTTATGSGSAQRLISTGRFVAFAYLNVLLWLSLFVLAPALVMGWRPMAVDSGSMGPAISPGDVVLVGEPGGQPLEAGRIITYRDPARPERLVTHRIVGIAEDGGYLTKGDANLSEDSTPVPADHVQGVAKLIVPRVGLPVIWVQQGRYAWLGAWALTVVLALGLVGNRRGDRRERASAPSRTRAARTPGVPRLRREPRDAGPLPQPSPRLAPPPGAPAPAAPPPAASWPWPPSAAPLPAPPHTAPWYGPAPAPSGGFPTVPAVRYKLRLPQPPADLVLPVPPLWSVSSVPPLPGSQPVAPIPAPPVAPIRRSNLPDRAERVRAPRLHGPSPAGGLA